MKHISRTRAAIKFLFWACATVAVFTYAIHSYRSGALVHAYYYKAKADGYAVNAASFQHATLERPVSLTIGSFEDVLGLKAAPVSKGSVLPRGTTGIIDHPVVQKGERVKLQDGALVVMVPWQLKESKGFTYRDGFTHKNIQTNPWSGVWNLVMVGLIGLSLGYLAEGFTDLVGLRFEKIDHTVGH
jgi:hypothetical protein